MASLVQRMQEKAEKWFDANTGTTTRERHLFYHLPKSDVLLRLALETRREILREQLGL